MKSDTRGLRCFVILTAVFCITGTVLAGTYSGGSGTIDDPYKIASAADLLALAADTNDYNKHFILTADIDLDPNLSGGQIFITAIIAHDTDNVTGGFQGVAFTGDFNGNGHTVRNLTIDTNEGKGDYLGLFGYISNGQDNQIKNLRLENIRITVGDKSSYVGGLVGSNQNNGWWGSSVITNCSSTGAIIGGANSSRLGGLVGGNASTYRGISNCFFTGTISGGVGSSYLGGLVGHSNSDISKSFSKGTVIGGVGSSYLGGLVGAHRSGVMDRYGYMNNCYSTSDVVGGVGSSQLGGLAGLNGSGIGNCYSTGAVTGEANSSCLGGLVGRDAVGIRKCYSTGAVTGGEGSSSLGGLVGVNSSWIGGSGGSFNCYFLGISGPDNSNGIPLTDTQMKQQSSFVGWDFIGETTNGTQDLWSVFEGVDYPKLAWQIIPPDMNEVSSTEATFVETVHTERWFLEDGNVVGDLNGIFDLNNFDIVFIKTGLWGGKGFSKAQCQATLEGVAYSGEWNGIVLPDTDVNKIILKGSITGEILATVEGTLTESIPGSDIYDRYQAVWKIGRIGNVTTSVTVNAAGKLTNLNSNEYPSTGLYVLQTAMDGNLAGDYSGPLSTVINHVRIADGNNPYNGQGFSIISYVSESGSGQGYTCDHLLPTGVVTMKGLFTDPLYGVLSAALDETTSPRSLYLSLQRIDLGLPPAPDLKVRTWGPERVSPGQTVDYIIEYRNDGLKAAEDFEVIMNLPLSINYISNTGGGRYNNESHEVVWYFDNLSPKNKGYLSVKETIVWGLAQGDLLDHIVSTPIGITEVQIDPNVTYEILQATEQPIEVTANIHNGLNSGIFSMSATLTEVNEHIQPILDYVETGDEIQIVWEFTVDGHSIDKVVVVMNCAKEAVEVVEIAKEIYEVNKTVKENQEWLGWLLNKQLISQEAYKNYSELNQSRPYTAIATNLLEKIGGFFAYLSGLVTVGREATYRGADSYLWLSHIRPNLAEALLRGDIPEWALRRYDKLKEYYLQEKSNSIDSHESVVTIARDPSVKYGPEGNVLPGQKLDYTVEYENEGEGIAFGVYFTDTLDEDLNDATLEIGPIIDVNTGLEIAPPGNYNPATRTITWFAGEVGPGEGGYSDVNICVRSDVNDGTEIINYATIYFPSVPEETRTNGIVSIVSLNQPPIADAGDDQIVYAGIGCIAEVNLDGSGSHDDDGDELTYSWLIDDEEIATGVTPTVELACGEHVIVLIVNDGVIASEPDEVVILVVAPMELSMKFTPRALNVGSNGRWVKAHFVLPEGYSVDDVDTDRPGVIVELGVESDHIDASINDEGFVAIVMAFGRGAFCESTSDYGPAEVTVVGFLSSGQSYYGADTIKIMSHIVEALSVLASNWLETDCGKPDWCNGADVDQNSVVDLLDYGLFDGCCIEVVEGDL